MNDEQLAETITRLRRLPAGGEKLESLVVEALVELQAWRKGALTEEILRRGDGYIRVGEGCLLVSHEWLNRRERPKSRFAFGCGKDYAPTVDLQPTIELLESLSPHVKQWATYSNYYERIGRELARLRAAQRKET